MRDLKFRCWDKREKMMIPWEVMRIWSGLLDRSLNNETHITMQFTGLLDKSGREIYEGDIVFQAIVEHWGSFNIPDDLIGQEKQRDEFRGVITFKDGHFDIEDKEYDRIPIIEDAYELEVIGNIYSDKHLLEKDA